jgi:phytoene dehydrogenase-like protein
VREVTRPSYRGAIGSGQNDVMPAATSAPRDYDAIVVGGGHNGLVCAAYLARAGMSTLLVEARSTVGGTASSEPFAGATVNICNCDHLTFRTTPVMEELSLERHGLQYVDVEPAQLNLAWSGGPAWASHHDVEQTLDSIGRAYPGEVEGYRRYLRHAAPAMALVLRAANDPPTALGLSRKVLSGKGAGVTTLLRWSRRSAADVMREFFTADALQAPGIVTGPMVWGISPELPGTGLGALTYALRHVSTVGRPIGGSGMVPRSVASAFVAAGGTIRTSTKVAAITCEGDAVRGIVLDDGTEITGGVVVSACNPHDTFLRWLRNAPPQAASLVERWRKIPHEEGYESKIDAIIDSLPRLRAVPDAMADQLGDAAANATAVIAPSLADIHRGFELIPRGEVLERPGLLLNIPTALDPSMSPPEPGPNGSRRHVLSLEALFTPYSLRGGWASSTEPRRWLEQLATQVEGDFLSTLGEWRAMTPDRYEREFHLPAGHATSFAGGPLAALLNRNPELTRYRTPVEGLYLTGAATFPGAGVWGASGRNAALTVLRRR